MLRNRKVAILATLVFLAVSLFTVNANATELSDIIPSPSKANGYVYDEYNILSDSDIAEINTRNKEIRKDTGGQIAVVIVKDLGGYEIEEYAAKLFEQWKIGDKDLNNGALYLIAIGDGKLRIETGYGTEGFIPDATAYKIIKNTTFYFPKGDKTGEPKSSYRKGIMEGFNEISKYYVNGEEPASSNYVDRKPEETNAKEGIGITLLFTLSYGMFLRLWQYAWRYMWKHKDDTYEDGTPKWHWYQSSSGGSFGSSSSSSRSSGSSSSGGFSGGGGRSGGGGASGSW